MSRDGPATSPAAAIDRRIRYAMRILESEQAPLAETAEVAARVGLSTSHFVRLFEDQVGLSPQDYGRGIAMRHAASRLRYSDDPVEEVAWDFGYAAQAAFSRAFARHHGVPPARWRHAARAESRAEIRRAPSDGVRLERMAAQRCFARRYLGPREDTAAQWRDFLARLPPDLRGRPRLGFAYDDPRVTPPARIRHDPAVAVADGAALPEALAADGFEVLRSPAGLWATAEVAPAEAAEGYRAILDGWFQTHPGYALEGDPHLERHGVAPGGRPRVTVCVRVRPAAARAAWNTVPVAPGA